MRNCFIAVQLTVIIGIALLGHATAETKTVDIKATGKYYNSVYKSWDTKNIRVYVDDEANLYINGGSTFVGGTGFITEDKYKALLAALRKSLEWAKKAKEAKLETTKEIASFITPYRSYKQGFSLVFFSTNSGKQTRVILEIKDFKNMIRSIKLYLEPDQVAQLITVLKKAPATLKALKESRKKADKILK